MSIAPPIPRPGLWRFVLCPLLTTILLVVVWKRQYEDGVTFRTGLHVFGFMLELVWLGPAAFLLAMIQLSISWPHLRPKGAARHSSSILLLYSIAICFLAPISSLNVMQHGFSTGRDRAYAAVDLTRLVAGCRALRVADLTNDPTATEAGTFRNDPTYNRLPKELLDLNPTDVYIGKRGVIVKMDGGGPATHEGFFVPVVPMESDPEAMRILNEQHRINQDPPVYRYFLYDSRILPYD